MKSCDGEEAEIYVFFRMNLEGIDMTARYLGRYLSILLAVCLVRVRTNVPHSPFPLP